MTPILRIYIDTNILISGFEDKSERGDIIGRLFSQAMEQMETPLRTSELTISELLVRPFENRDDRLIQEYRSAFASSWLQAAPVDRNILELAALIRARRKRVKLPDAIHMATALTSNCTHFLTNDAGFEGLAESLTGTSENWLGNWLPPKLLRPDLPTLTSLLQSIAP